MKYHDSDEVGAAVIVRFGLFVATGLALPLYSFPVARVYDRPIDAATVLAAAFVGMSLPALLSFARSLPGRLFLSGAAALPLLALLPPRPAYFSLAAFAASYAHWLLVAGFFAAALSLPLREGDGRRLVLWNVAAAVVVAAFGLYQAVGIPRHWPGTGPRLLPMQREDFRFMLLGSGYMRPMSLFLEPAWLGGYLCWCLALALAAWGSAGRMRRVWGAAAAILAMTIVATVSLGAFADLVGLSVAFGLVAARAGRLSRRSLGRAAATLGALLLLAALSPWGRSLGEALALRSRNVLATPAALRQASPALNDSSWMRVRNVALTLEEFRSRPLTGIGLGQFYRYLPPERRNPLLVDEPWCGWLALAAQMGVLGPLVLAGALALVVARARACALDGTASLAVPALVVIAAVQQLHTASFIDLWWWYPVAVGGMLAAGGEAAGTLPAKQSGVSSA